MHPTIFPSGVAAAWFHRIYDDPVVGHLQAHSVGGLRKGSICRLPIAKTPVEGAIVRRFRMDLGSPHCQAQFHIEIIIVELDHLSRVTGLFHGLSDDHRHRLADVAHTMTRQHGALGSRALAAVDIIHHHPVQMGLNTGLNQIGLRDHQMNTIRLARILDVECRDLTMGDGAAKDKGPQRALWHRIFDVATLTCQQTLIFHPCERLTFSKFLDALVHEMAPSACAQLRRSLMRETGLSSDRVTMLRENSSRYHLMHGHSEPRCDGT